MKMWLVGAGYWGRKLLTALEKLEVHPEIIDIKNGQTIDDIHDESPVILATPLWNHYAQCRELLKRGHDVYVEKPMAETSEEISELKSLCGADQLVMVGHIFQHHPHRFEIKQLIDSGIIGKITHIHSCRMNWGIYQTHTDPVLSLGTHDISIVLDLTQDSDAVVTQSQGHYYSQGSRPDRVQWSGRCGSTTFDCDVSWMWPRRIRETIIIGTKAQIIWDQDTNTYTISENRIINNRAQIDPDPKVMSYHYEFSPLEFEIKHWIDCVTQRKLPSTGFDQALAVARVIDQITY